MDNSSEKNSTCGGHLCAIIIRKMVAKCGVFGQELVGAIEEGLDVCWGRILKIPLSQFIYGYPELKNVREGAVTE